MSIAPTSASTTSPAVPVVATPAAPPEEMRLYQLSVSQYHEMIRQDILREDDPVELLEGYLVQKMPKNPPHRVLTKLVRKALEQIVENDQYFVDSQEPITTTDSEPEPDASR